MSQKTILEWMLDRISPEPNSGCWLWMGAVNKRDYGSVGGHSSAHRVMYTWVKGPIPEGKELDHLCRVYTAA